MSVPSNYLLNGLFRIRHISEANTLAAFLAEPCPNPRLAVVGITELLLNAIEHGNLGITYEQKTQLQLQGDWIAEMERLLAHPEFKDKFVDVEFTRFETEIHIKVTDQGAGFDWKSFTDGVHHAQQHLLSSHGRGILLAKQLTFKELIYSPKGNEVTGIITL